MTDNLVPTASYSPGCRAGSPGAGNVICLTDNSEVYYYMDSSGEFELEPDDRAVVNNNLDYEFRPTHLAFHYDSDPTFSGGGETDLIYQEGFADADFDGVTWCNDAVDSATYRCDQAYVRIRGNGAYTINLACHETGHAVGLTHGAFASPYIANNDMRLGCMTTSSLTYDLGDNQVQNINSVY
ncbi:hypothetical protein ACN2WE_32310 [Streptomyces sp. cg28]|uniref:hypothetical protein n=1 Tax=Streptomyces sp. cg28 TaxID=3403457 RepID=UPI003B2142FA